jgi:hypothetical protein
MISTKISCLLLTTSSSTSSSFPIWSIECLYHPILLCPSSFSLLSLSLHPLLSKLLKAYDILLYFILLLCLHTKNKNASISQGATRFRKIGNMYFSNCLDNWHTIVVISNGCNYGPTYSFNMFINMLISNPLDLADLVLGN